ncbi:peptidase M20/M25/M40 family protein [Lysobacter antibioticus]|uniref:M20/M25/M40 family metallo-hydrolase n=1 Tax=Lysobacter antibioticus TaxID=84531 RepID=UPI00071727F1|nr:M20/M25/M40 family metallo-hydrolase [Lysobacter antibioticus]ALN64281.1 peptidase M20/M25/M40 family protein [Lysobacter antibioticus]
MSSRRSRTVRLLPAVLAVVLAQAGAAPPKIAITETAVFDAASVPAFTGDYADVYAHLQKQRAADLAQLQRWVRQPSISAQDKGIDAMAELLRGDLQKLGFRDTALVPTTGHPGVYGYYDAGAEHTLVVYMMYDVQPIEPTGWKVDAFDGALVDDPKLGKVLMARGATNQKGPQRAFLNALDAVIQVRGKPPVNLIVLAEGEEELGSPHYPEVVAKYEAQLRKADGVFFPMNTQDRDGEASMFLGVKGILYLELEAKGNAKTGGPQKSEVHGSLAAKLDSPSWRLVQALATLTTPDGEIAVPGYRDAIRAPNVEEQRLFNGLVAKRAGDTQKQLDAFAAARWKNGRNDRDASAAELFDTTLNIDGLVAGYTGEGVKTILPHRAVAKVDSRLVPDQTPDEAVALIRKQLDAKGFDDIEIRKLSGYPPAQTSVEAPLTRAAIGTYRKHGFTPPVAPRIGGSAPYYVFTQTLGLPMIAGGLGHGSGAHAPNEYMVIEPLKGSKIAGLVQTEQFYVDLLYSLADALKQPKQ